MSQDHKFHIGIQCMAHVGMANGLAGAVDAGKKTVSRCLLLRDGQGQLFFKVFTSERWAGAAVPHVNFMRNLQASHQLDSWI